MLQQVDSRYMLVNIIARRAREISVGIGTSDGYPDDKPVSRAIEEIASGELRITLPDE
jgi:DNA-directed RNA polymerase subunit omega